MENQENKTQTIEINSTCNAVVISPKLTGTMALIDLGTLQRITAMLSLSSLRQIKDNLIYDIDKAENLEQYNQILKEEVLFHESINLIKTIKI